MNSTSIGWLVCTFSSLAGASELEVLCTDWKDYCNPDGSGIYFEIVDTIYRPSYSEIKKRVLPYKRSIFSAQQGHADIILGSYNNEIKNMLYPNNPDAYDAIYLLTNRQNAPAATLQDISLKNKKLLLLKNNQEYINLIPFNAHLYFASNFENAQQLLKINRYDYLILEEDNLPEKYSSNIVALYYRSILTYPAFPDTPEGRKNRARWDQQLPQLRDNGQLQQIYLRYGRGSDYATLLTLY